MRTACGPARPAFLVLPERIRYAGSGREKPAGQQVEDFTRRRSPTMRVITVMKGPTAEMNYAN